MHGTENQTILIIDKERDFIVILLLAWISHQPRFPQISKQSEPLAR